MATAMGPVQRAPAPSRRPVPPVLLAALVLGALLVALVQVNLLGYTFSRLGLSPGWGLAVIMASVVGGAVNLPVMRITAQVSQPRLWWTPLGWVLTVVPARPTVLAVNVGGALVPVGLSAYLVVTNHIALPATVAVTAVALVVHRYARVIPEVGVVLSTFWPALAACFVTTLLHPSASAALAYVAGTVGTLVGADLTNLRAVVRDAPPVVSIGGAGTFDGIVFAGVVAVLLVTIL